MKRALVAILAAAPLLASAYCVENRLADRRVVVEQEEHTDPLRNDRRFKHVLAPGERRCCEFHNLDCNPGGRENAVVNLMITVPGEPQYLCGFPEGSKVIKVTGAGTLSVQPNPRKSAYPVVVRVRTHDRKDLTGPAGLVCPEPPKEPPKELPKGK